MELVALSEPSYDIILLLGAYNFFRLRPLGDKTLNMWVFLPCIPKIVSRLIKGVAFEGTYFWVKIW